MAKFILSDSKLYLAQYDLSADLFAMELSSERDAVDATLFGADTKSSLPGLASFSWAHQGLYEAGTDKVDAVLWAKRGVQDVVATIGPQDGNVGSVAYFAKTVQLKYQFGGSVGERFAFTVGGGGTGDLVRGQFIVNSALTATTTTTPLNLGAVAAGQSIHAALHVLAASGTTPTLDVVIQSDDASGFLSPTTRLTFTQATAPTSEWKSAAGAITDTWWRASITVGGTTPSFTTVLVLGIQ